MASSEPLVSIIIPTFNRAHLIGETLDSVLAQTYTNWECIVVDDGSTDDTDAVVGAYVTKDPRFKYYHRPLEHLPGGNGARNFGFKMSNGEYLIFLDSDDLITNDCVLKRKSNIVHFKCKMLVNITGTFKRSIGDSNIIWNKPNITHNNIDNILRFINLDMPWHTTSVTWDRVFFDSVSGWNENLIAWQDWEMHCRTLFSKNHSMKVINEVDHYFRTLRRNNIGNLIKTEKYFKSVFVAVKNIDKLLRENIEVHEYVKGSYIKLICNIFIRYPLKYGFYWFPLKLLFNFNFFVGFGRIKYLEFYFKELLFKSYKIRNYYFNNSYLNHREHIALQSTYLKLSLKDA